MIDAEAFLLLGLCPACLGSGRDEAIASQPCAACDGKGRPGSACAACEGVGEIWQATDTRTEEGAYGFWRDCRACGGSGRTERGAT